MPSYATTDGLKSRFRDLPELAFYTDDEVVGVPTESKLTAVLDAAEGAINSRLAKRYLTPVDVSGDATLAATLEQMTLDLAEPMLIRSRSERLSAVKQAQLDGVLEWATAIAAGTFELPGAVQPASNETRADFSRWSGSNRTLSSTSPRVWTRPSTERL